MGFSPQPRTDFDAKYSRPVLIAIFAKLFNIIMSAGYVPYGFRLSYTVPLPKVDTVSSKNAIDNYKAVSTSPILSNIFERCITDTVNFWLVVQISSVLRSDHQRSRYIFFQVSCRSLCEWWFYGKCSSFRFIKNVR